MELKFPLIVSLMEKIHAVIRKEAEQSPDTPELFGTL